MKGFRKVKLNDITVNLDKIRIPLSSYERSKLEKKYPYYGAQGIIDYVDNFIFDGEYLLVAEDGENLKSQKNKICNFVNGQFWVNNHAHILQANEENDIKYIYYKLNLINFRPYISGSAQPKLTQDNLNKIELTIHDLKNQQKIATVLSTLDSKIELNNRINTELEAIAKTLYDYWFVQFDFHDANGKPYKTSGGKMVYNAALKREIPEGWADIKIGRMEPNIVTGKTPSTANSDYFNGEIPFITIGDIRGSAFIVKTEQTLSIEGANSQGNKYLPKGAICVTCIASPGLVGFVTQTSQTNQQINSVICSNEFNRYFLYFAINGYFSGAKAKTGNTFANMNKGDFSEILVVEPLEDIRKFFHEKIDAVFKEIKIKSQENIRLEQLRDYLLPMLMNGQVTVVNKDDI